jgi:hypothetical protein
MQLRVTRLIFKDIRLAYTDPVSDTMTVLIKALLIKTLLIMTILIMALLIMTLLITLIVTTLFFI